jgi:hypothetical protein
VILGWVLVATARTQLCDSLDTNVQGLELLPGDALSHTPAQVLHQESHTAVLREREGVETHPPPPSRDCSALIERTFRLLVHLHSDSCVDGFDDFSRLTVIVGLRKIISVSVV